MDDAQFQLQALADVRLADHAASALPAWLWATDGAKILWANPVGAQLLGAANATALAKRAIGPADPQRRQVVRLAPQLAADGAPRLEKLRGFGAPNGMLATCGCARLALPDGSHGILISALDATVRTMSFAERMRRLVQSIDQPAAAFTPDGIMIAASDSARGLPGLHDLADAGLAAARDEALNQGRAHASVAFGRVVLQRIGRGSERALIALITPAPHLATQAKAAPPPPIVTPPPPPSDEVAAPHDALPSTVAEQPVAPEPAAAIADEPQAIVAETPETPQDAAASTEETSSEITLFDALDPASEPTAETAPAPAPTTVSEPEAADTAPSIAITDDAESGLRRHPLRFMWQMDHEGRFSLGSDEFARLIGLHTAAGFGRLWTDLSTTFNLDPDDRVMKAVATRDTWSGITLDWPADGGGRLPVELSGLPVFDRNRTFVGYRGFGVCRDLDGLARLASLRRNEFIGGPPLPPPADAAPAEPSSADAGPPGDVPVERSALEPSRHADPEHPADTPQDTSVTMPPHQSQDPQQETAPGMTDTSPNVVPFRLGNDARSSALTQGENNAFNELARQLSTRLESEAGLIASAPEIATETAASTEPAAELPVTTEPSAAEPPQSEADNPVANSLSPSWLLQPEPAPHGQSRRDKTLLDLLPVGILIYRLDRLLYANHAFLDRMGYHSLRALEDAGGLDALYVAPGVSQASSSSGTGTPVTISASQATETAPVSISADARLHTITWDDDSALALIFSGTHQEDAAVAAALSAPAAEPEPDVDAEPEAAAELAPEEIPEPPQAGHADAEELAAILDTAAEGIIMFDAEGTIHSCNRSAEALFGYDGDDFITRKLTELFAPESQHAVLDYLASLKSAGVQSLLDHGREVLGRVRQGGIIPLAVTMGRTRADGPNFFAVFRDLSQSKQGEGELREAKRLAERAANAKSDMLARISHELRAPLNAIIGFAEVMIGERFGALGNERYAEYMKDIRASGERVIDVINDMLDLSRIETGKLDLAFSSQNLNEMVESCVAVMQPQANRERIIIRTSLAHTLPPVVADARALRQITLNLIGNSIHLANTGGQVIVSTALSDFGEVMLRVRDTGQGLNDNEVAAALEPFRAPTPADHGGTAGVTLSLTKALVEANRAKFQIRTGGRSGTLIEVVFSHATARV